MIIFGQHPVKDLLSDSSIRVKRVYVKNKNILDDLVKINKSIRNIDSIKISEKDFYELTKSNSHQGLAVEIETPKLYEYTDFKKNIHELGRIIMVIDHVVDPHNLGAIIRSCVFFDINTVVIPKNRAASITPGSIKSSAGTIFKSTIYEVSNLKNILIEGKTIDLGCGNGIVGISLSYEISNTIDWCLTSLIILSAVLLQIGSNYANDAYDYLKGADSQSRK